MKSVFIAKTKFSFDVIVQYSATRNNRISNRISFFSIFNFAILEPLIEATSVNNRSIQEVYFA